MIKQVITTAVILTHFFCVSIKPIAEPEIPIYDLWASLTVEQQDKADIRFKACVAHMSEEEFRLFSAVVEAESDRGKGKESLENRTLIAVVIFNRVKSKKFPNTITKVIKQRGQFSVVSSGAYKRVGRSNLADRAIIEAYRREMMKEAPNILYFNCIGFFKGHKRYKKVGDNYFSY